MEKTMPTMYKLVSQEWTTHNGMKWAIGKTNKATGEGTEMCTNQVLHCYASPEQAVLFNPIHANIYNPILLEIECSEIVANDGLKYACKEQTPKKEICLPVFSLNQKIAFAIKMALLVYKAAPFVKWAEKWLSGKNRTADDADAAARAAARAAAYAADAAADAATYAAYAAYAAADAATYAAYAARAATYAADAARAVPFQTIIEWVKENIV